MSFDREYWKLVTELDKLNQELAQRDSEIAKLKDVIKHGEATPTALEEFGLKVAEEVFKRYHEDDITGAEIVQSVMKGEG